MQNDRRLIVSELINEAGILIESSRVIIIKNLQTKNTMFKGEQFQDIKETKEI